MSDVARAVVESHGGVEDGVNIISSVGERPDNLDRLESGCGNVDEMLPKPGLEVPVGVDLEPTRGSTEVEEPTTHESMAVEAVCYDNREVLSIVLVVFGSEIMANANVVCDNREVLAIVLVVTGSDAADCVAAAETTALAWGKIIGLLQTQ